MWSRLYTKLIVISFFSFVLSLGLSKQAYAMSVVVNVPEKYVEVDAGERLYFETDIKWPENTDRKDLRLEYTVKDENDVDIAYLKVLKAVETQASFMDSITIPGSTDKGLYKLSARVLDYDQLDVDAEVSFKVNRSDDTLTVFLYSVIGVLGVAVLLLVIEMSLLIKRSSHTD